MDDKRKTGNTRIYAPTNPNAQKNKAHMSEAAKRPKTGISSQGGRKSSGREQSAQHTEPHAQKTPAQQIEHFERRSPAQRDGAEQKNTLNAASGLKRARTAAQYAAVAQKAKLKPVPRSASNTVYYGSAVRGESTSRKTGTAKKTATKKAGSAGESAVSFAAHSKANVRFAQSTDTQRNRPKPEARVPIQTHGRAVDVNAQKNRSKHEASAKSASRKKATPVKVARSTPEFTRKEMGSRVKLIDTPQMRDKKLKRRKARIKALCISAAAVCVIAGAFLAVKYLFEIKTISVNNSTTFDDSYIIGLSGIGEGENLIFLNTQSVERSLGGEPRIISHVKKVFPDSVVITVEERLVAAVIDNGSHKVAMDIEGNILSIDSAEIAESISVKGLEGEAYFVGKNIRDDTDYTKHALFLVLDAIIGNESGVKVSGVDVSNPLSIKLVLKSSLCVCIGEALELKEKLDAIVKIEERLLSDGLSKGMLDISILQKPVYSPASVELTPANTALDPSLYPSLSPYASPSPNALP